MTVKLQFCSFSCQGSLTIQELIFSKPTKISAYPLILTLGVFSDDTLNQITIEWYKRIYKTLGFGRILPPETGRIPQQQSGTIHTTSSELEFYTPHLLQV